jgi:cysteine desulfurase
MRKVYADYAATSPCDPGVVRRMEPFFAAVFANAHSAHAQGQEARTAVEDAREYVADMLGAVPGEVVFTSGGTEADNTAVIGTYLANRGWGNHLVTTTIEHHAVLEAVRYCASRFGARVSEVACSPDGRVDPDRIVAAIAPDTVLVSVMHANNETGVIQPIAEIGERVRALNRTRSHRVYFHTDAVQTFGHLPIAVDALGVDLLSASAHKFCGPKGVGFLYVRTGTRMDALLHGGGHEDGRRSSTLNTPGIVGLHAAARIARENMASEADRVRALRDMLWDRVRASVPDVVVNGTMEHRLDGNLNVAFPGVEGESLLVALDAAGIAVSTGSACSSGSQEASHVLLAMGIDPVTARSSLRFTLGRFSGEEDVQRILEVLPPVVTRLRDMSPVYRKAGT